MNKKKIYTISIFEHCVSTDRKVNQLAPIFAKFALQFSDYLYLFYSFADGRNRIQYWK